MPAAAGPLHSRAIPGLRLPVATLLLANLAESGPSSVGA